MDKNIQFQDRPSESFKRWARENGVNLNESDDWEPWWACWIDGHNTALRIQEEATQ